MSTNSTSMPKRSARCSPRARTPEPLGGVVAGGDEVDPGLARQVHHPLADLAGEEEVEAGVDRFREDPLGAAADDAGGGYGVGAMGEEQRLAAEELAAALGELRHRHRVGEAAAEAPGLAVQGAEGGQLPEAQGAGGQGVVAQLGMAVERQVVGQQAQLAVHQLGHAAVLDAGEDRRVAAPEDAVVDQDGVGADPPGGLEQLATGRYAR